MDRRPEASARSLRDYPISLRHSARAVYGEVLEQEEQQAESRRDRPAQGAKPGSTRPRGDPSGLRDKS